MTNQQGAPEALRLADALECRTTSWPDKVFAAAVIRRLYAENERLAALVEAPQPSPTPQADSQPVLPEITAEDRSFLHYNPNTDDIVEWVQHYASAAITADRAARAPADSVPPMTETGTGPKPVTDADVRNMSARVISGQAEEDELLEFFARLAPPHPVHIAAPTPPAQAADSQPAPAGGANWQDISTAPKDGTQFVAVGNNYGLDSETQHTCIAQWFRGCWMEVSDWNEASELKYLTHWMPLPPLPGSAARKQGGA